MQSDNFINIGPIWLQLIGEGAELERHLSHCKKHELLFQKSDNLSKGFTKIAITSLILVWFRCNELEKVQNNVPNVVTRSGQGRVKVRSRSGQGQVKVRSRSPQGWVKVILRLGQGQVKVTPKSGQGHPKVRSRSYQGRVKVTLRSGQGHSKVRSMSP